MGPYLKDRTEGGLSENATVTFGHRRVGSVFAQLKNMESQPMLWVFCLYLQVICSPVSSEVWKVDIVPRMRAMTKSCVVIPCTFTYPGNIKSKAQQRAIRFEKNDPKIIIYDEDQSKIDNNFKERTRLVGSLGESNCSLEIDDIKDYDAGEFCFRIEIPKLDKFSFKDNCVVIRTFDDPDPPNLIHNQDPVEGSPFIISCSVFHTCPSHVPTLTWIPSTRGEIITMHKNIGDGKWETQSILTFTPTQDDDNEEVSCTVKHHGDKTMKSAIKLNMKRDHMGTTATWMLVTEPTKRSFPRCPSPKSNPKSTWGANSGKGRNNDNCNDFADANIYGNI